MSGSIFFHPFSQMRPTSYSLTALGMRLKLHQTENKLWSLGFSHPTGRPKNPHSKVNARFVMYVLTGLEVWRVSVPQAGNPTLAVDGDVFSGNQNMVFAAHGRPPPPEPPASGAWDPLCSDRGDGRGLPQLCSPWGALGSAARVPHCTGTAWPQALHAPPMP